MDFSPDDSIADPDFVPLADITNVDSMVSDDDNSVHTNLSTSLPTSKRDSVKSYLSLLPKLPSHYCRQTSTKQYVEPIVKSKSQLYNLYVRSRKLFFFFF